MREDINSFSSQVVLQKRVKGQLFVGNINKSHLESLLQSFLLCRIEGNSTPYLSHFLLDVPQRSKNLLQVVHHSLDLISNHLPAAAHFLYLQRSASGRSALDTCLDWAQDPSVLRVCSGLPGASESCRAVEASLRNAGGEHDSVEGPAEALHRWLPQVSLALGRPALLLDVAEAGSQAVLC